MPLNTVAIIATLYSPELMLLTSNMKSYAVKIYHIIRRLPFGGTSFLIKDDALSEDPWSIQGTV